jgi:hypothetical protein
MPTSSLVQSHRVSSALYHAGHNGVLVSSAISCLPSDTKEGSTLNKENCLDELQELCGRNAYEKKDIDHVQDAEYNRRRDWLQEIAYNTQDAQ